MWIRLLLNKWVLGALGVGAILSGAYLYGREGGLLKGYESAVEQHTANLEAIQQEWARSLSERDLEWSQALQDEIKVLNESIAQQEKDAARESELLLSLKVIETRFEEIFDESLDSDFGSCNLTLEFDGLFDDISTPAGTSSDRSNQPAGNPGNPSPETQ